MKKPQAASDSGAISPELEWRARRGAGGSTGAKSEQSVLNVKQPSMHSRRSADRGRIRMPNLVSKNPVYSCLQCSKTFTRYRFQKKGKYCSDHCSAKAAKGRWVPMARKGWAASRDANHHPICAMFEALGCSVLDCSNVGIPGFPDLVIGCLGINHLVEVKNPATPYGRRGYNQNQSNFFSKWRGDPGHIVRTEEEVIALVASWRASVNRGNSNG